MTVFGVSVWWPVGRRDLALSTRRAQARAKVSAIARHYRRHGGVR